MKRYSIGYPGGWVEHHNKPEQACLLIDPEPFTFPEDSEPPPVALRTFLLDETFDAVVRSLTEDSSRTVLRREETNLGGRRTVILELQSTGGALEEKGTKIYFYVMDKDGKAFAAEAYAPPRRTNRYPEFKQVLDQAVKTLKFF